MVAHDPHPRPLHLQGNGSAVPHRGRRLHVLPRHRSDLPAHRSRHHQERAARAGAAAPDLHAPRVPRPHPADGPARDGTAGLRAHRRRPRGRRAQGLRGESPAALPPVPRDRHHHHPAHLVAHPRGGAVVERRLPAAALPDLSVAGRHRYQGAHLQRDLQSVRDLRGRGERLPGPPQGHARLRRAERGAVPHHRGPRGPPPERRGHPPYHPALPGRLDQRAKLPDALAWWPPNIILGLVGIIRLRGCVGGAPPAWVDLYWRLWATIGERQSGRMAKPLEERRRRRLNRLVGPRASTFIMDRYLIRQYLIFLGIGTGIGASLIAGVDLLQTLDRFLRSKPPCFTILETFLYRMPGELYKGLPLIVLFAPAFLFLSLTPHRT